MEAPSKLGSNESGDGEGSKAGQSANLSFVPRQWTPDYASRATMGVKKVRSAKDGPFMGGDWVLNSQGQGATLSFCFLNPGATECFGLTVGHLADGVGEPIFRFAESKPIPVPDDSDKDVYFTFEVGTVTSISDETDSLVFKMHLERDECHCHPNLIALSSQSHITLDQHLVSSIQTPKEGTMVVGFGAQRRGAFCMVMDPSKSSSGKHSLKGDIGLQNIEVPSEAVTDGGDCGAIFCSVYGMAPLYFHHVLTCLSEGTMVSYGVPLLKILEAHEETRHLVPTWLSGDQGHEPQKKKAKTFGSPLGEPLGEASERVDLHQFHTKVVDAPTRADVLKVCETNHSRTDVWSARRGLTAPDSVAVEDQQLPVFNVRVKTRADSTVRDIGRFKTLV